MEVVVLTDHYCLRPSATQICARKVAEELARRGHKVVVVTLGDKRRDSYQNGVTIHEVKDVVYAALLGDGCSKSRKIISKITGYLICLGGLLFRFELSHRYAKVGILKLTERVVRDLGDRPVLLSFSEPFSSHRLARSVKKRLGSSVVWAAVELDPFGLSYIKKQSELKKRMRLEEAVLADADLLFFAEGIQAENDKHGYLAGIGDKLHEITLPGLCFNELPIREHEQHEPPLAREDSKVHFIYTGMFYPDVRTPDCLLNQLRRSSLDYELNIYGPIGEKWFDSYRAEREKTILHGRKSPEECDQACFDSDVLVDIQNDVPNQIPSKTFRYMATGKPIVCFYQKGCELGVKYLERYQNALIIEKGSLIDADVFDSFCLNALPISSQDKVNEILEPYMNEKVVNVIEAAILSELS